VKAHLGPRPAPIALLALTAFVSACGLVPERVAGLECQRMPAGGGELREGEDPLAAGGPFEGVPVMDMTAEAVAQRAEDEGYGVTYRYQYDVGPQPENGGTGYSECWCVPPPDGRVIAVNYDAIGRIIVMVQSEQARDSVRPQPVQGWGCDEEPASS
jgi:hypothetical protein